MPHCIYCQQHQSEEGFTKVEHVMPQSFGRFRNNFTLRNLVCDDCNHYFGNHLELFLARDSQEGQLRFRRGLKGADEFKGIGRDTRIVVRSTEGAFSGCYMLRYYNAHPEPIVALEIDPPDVAARLAAKGITFNYLAYWEGGAFVQQQRFDQAPRPSDHSRLGRRWRIGPFAGIAAQLDDLSPLPCTGVRRTTTSVGAGTFFSPFEPGDPGA